MRTVTGDRPRARTARGIARGATPNGDAPPRAIAGAHAPFWRLRFSDALERRFLDERVGQNRTLVRFTMTSCLVVHLATIALDLLLLHSHLHHPMAALGMYGIALPMAIVYTTLTYLPRGMHWLRYAAPYLVAINGPGISLMLLAPGPLAAPPTLPDILTVLNPIFGLLLAGMFLRQSLPAAVFVVTFHFVLKIGMGTPFAVLVTDVLMFYSILSLCMIGAWQLERVERANWLNEQALRAAAVTDPLTGMANRQHLFEQGTPRLRHARRNGQSLSILMIDVDQFKEYNDAYGHAAGDECLRRVAGEIAAAARRPLDLAVRYGGEEFLMLLTTDRQGACLRSEHLRSAVAALHIPHTASRLGRVTISVGVADAADLPDASLDGLIAAADEAMYRAKRAGRNRIAAIEPGRPGATERAGDGTANRV